MDNRYRDKLLDEINETKRKEEGIKDFSDLLIDDKNSTKKHGSAFRYNKVENFQLEEENPVQPSVYNKNNSYYHNDIPHSHYRNDQVWETDEVNEVDEIVRGNPYIRERDLREQNILLNTSGKIRKIRRHSFAERVSYVWRIIKITVSAIFILLTAIFIYLIKQGYTPDKIQNIITIERNKDKLGGELVSLAKHNVDAIPFVMNKLLPGDKINKSGTIDEFIRENKKKNNKSAYPYMSAFNLLWSDYQYDGNYLALTGSGPLCLSSIFFKHELYLFNPEFIAKYMQEKTKQDNESHMSREGLLAFADAFSFTVKEIDKSEDTIKAYLSEGMDILCLINSKNAASLSKEIKHYVIISDVNSNGYINIIDFQDKKLSENKIKFAEILDKIIAIYAVAV